jgi:hypothetical protein
LSSLEHLYQQTGLHWCVFEDIYYIKIEGLTVFADECCDDNEWCYTVHPSADHEYTLPDALRAVFE